MDELPQKGAFTIQEFLSWSGIGRTSAYAAISAGELKAVKMGHRTLIPVTSAQEWLNNLPEAAA